MKAKYNFIIACICFIICTSYFFLNSKITIDNTLIFGIYPLFLIGGCNIGIAISKTIKEIK